MSAICSHSFMKNKYAGTFLEASLKWPSRDPQLVSRPSLSMLRASHLSQTASYNNTQVHNTDTHTCRTLRAIRFCPRCSVSSSSPLPSRDAPQVLPLFFNILLYLLFTLQICWFPSLLQSRVCGFFAHTLPLASMFSCWPHENIFVSFVHSFVLVQRPADTVLSDL